MGGNEKNQTEAEPNEIIENEELEIDQELENLPQEIQEEAEVTTNLDNELSGTNSEEPPNEPTPPPQKETEGDNHSDENHEETSSEEAPHEEAPHQDDNHGTETQQNDQQPNNSQQNQDTNETTNENIEQIEEALNEENSTTDLAQEVNNDDLTEDERKRFNAMRASSFAKAVWHTKYKIEDTATGGKAGKILGTGATAVGFGASALMLGTGAIDSAKNIGQLDAGVNAELKPPGEQGDSSTEEYAEAGKFAKIMGFIKVVLMSLSILKGVLTVSKKRGTVSSVFLDLAPSVLNVLASLASAIITLLNPTKATKAAQHALTAVTPTLKIFSTAVDHIRLTNQQKKLKKLRNIDNAISDDDYKTISDSLSKKAKAYWSVYLPAIAQVGAKITYAIAFYNNPNSKTSLISKLVASGADTVAAGVDIANSELLKKKPNERQTAVANSIFTEFQNLRNDNVYMGYSNATEADGTNTQTFDKRNSLEAYTRVKNKLAALDVTDFALTKSKSRAEQNQLIVKAVGY